MGWDFHIRKVARAMGISSSHTVLPTATRSACDGFRDNPCWRGAGLPTKKYHRSRNVSRPRRSARRPRFADLPQADLHPRARNFVRSSVRRTPHALGFPCPKPPLFRRPVMRRLAISMPNVIAALRRLRRDQARPYNFALLPVVVNLSNTPLTLLAPFEKDPSKWTKLPYVNIHDGTTHHLENPTLPFLVQTFEMVFSSIWPSRSQEFRAAL